MNQRLLDVSLPCRKIQGDENPAFMSLEGTNNQLPSKRPNHRAGVHSNLDDLIWTMDLLNLVAPWILRKNRFQSSAESTFPKQAGLALGIPLIPYIFPLWKRPGRIFYRSSLATSGPPTNHPTTHPQFCRQSHCRGCA